MRKLGTLGDPEAARKFADLLRNRAIAAEFRVEAEGNVGVWVRDEDQLPAAREELAAFERNPHAPLPSTPVPPTPAESATQTAPDPRGPAQVWRRVPVTLGLIALSVAVGFGTKLGHGETPLANEFSIASYEVDGDRVFWNPAEGLSDVRSGQVWRLVTPMFLHFGVFHLLFNMMWLWTLGGAIESLRGSFRFLALVLATAVLSNLAEYYLNFGFDFGVDRGFVSDFGVDPNPFFGGMSGVVFGLFGFVWMRARFVPGSRFSMPKDTVVWMVGWLLLCTSGFVGPIANVAHGVGLLAGMAIGAAPRLWRRA